MFALRSIIVCPLTPASMKLSCLLSSSSSDTFDTNDSAVKFHHMITVPQSPRGLESSFNRRSSACPIPASLANLQIQKSTLAHLDRDIAPSSLLILRPNEIADLLILRLFNSAFIILSPLTHELLLHEINAPKCTRQFLSLPSHRYVTHLSR